MSLISDRLKAGSEDGIFCLASQCERLTCRHHDDDSLPPLHHFEALIACMALVHPASC